MDNLIEEIRQAINENRFYDFIANNYHRIDKSVLAFIIGELDFYLYERNKNVEAENIMLENLKERYE